MNGFYPQALVDTLFFVNYATNRDLRPDIPPERYSAAGYPNVPAMEAKYQAERAIAKAKAAL